MASAPEPADQQLTSAKAYQVFEAIRWPDGEPTHCPHCGAASSCRLIVPRDGLGRATRTGAESQRRVWRCPACRRQFSVLTGSVFEGTRVSLVAWLTALSCVRDGRLDAAEVVEMTGVHRDTARSMVELVVAAGGCESDQLQG